MFPENKPKNKPFIYILYIYGPCFIYTFKIYIKHGPSMNSVVSTCVKFVFFLIETANKKRCSSWLG